MEAIFLCAIKLLHPGIRQAVVKPPATRNNSTMILLTYLFVGAIAGVLAGLLGVGGGLVLVPVLAYLLPSQGVSNDIVMHVALGTSLATIIVTSLSSIRAHKKRDSVRWEIVKQLAPGIIIGAFIGGWIADLLSTTVLQKYFGLFAIVIGAKMALNRPPKIARQLGSNTALTFSGGIIGVISSLAGIGGGSLTVPYLVRHQIPMVKAVGTSSACGLPIAVAGATGYLWSGWGNALLPAWSTGYLYWPAIIAICAASYFCAPIGAWLAHKLPVKVLKRIFSSFLICIGIFLLIK